MQLKSSLSIYVSYTKSYKAIQTVFFGLMLMKLNMLGLRLKLAAPELLPLCVCLLTLSGVVLGEENDAPVQDETKPFHGCRFLRQNVACNRLAILMHTGKDGSLTKAVDDINKLGDEIARIHQGAAGTSSWWDWLLSWKAAILGIVLLLMMFAMCCVIPMIQSTVRRMVANIAVQHVALHCEPRTANNETNENDIDRDICKAEDNEVALQILT